MRGLAFRAFLRKYAASNPKLESLTGLRNLRKFNEMLDMVEVEWSAQREAKGLASGTISDFLDWLLENADELILIIVKLIDLFSD